MISRSWEAHKSGCVSCQSFPKRSVKPADIKLNWRFLLFSKNYCSKIILTIAAEVENESKNKIIRSSVLHFATVSTLIMNSEFSVLTSKCDDVLELNQSVMKPNEPSPRFYSIAEAE